MTTVNTLRIFNKPACLRRIRGNVRMLFVNANRFFSAVPQYYTIIIARKLINGEMLTSQSPLRANDSS